MERKIGEIFEFGGEWYQCVSPGLSCAYCDMNKHTCYGVGACSKGLRTDGKEVVYKKLEKVGNPYVYNGTTCQLYKSPIPIYATSSDYKIVRYDMIEVAIKQNQEDMEENKMNLKPFDLEAARSGKTVCTRDGRKARIICFDSINKGNYPIIALIEDKGYESLFYYNENGESNIGTDFNLMMPPEKHEGWVNIYKLKSPAYKDFPYACLLSPTKNGAISIMDSNDLPSSSVELLKNLLVDDVLKDNPLIATVRIEWNE